MNTKNIKLPETFAFIDDNHSRHVTTWRDLFKDKNDVIALAKEFAIHGFNEAREPMGYYELPKDRQNKSVELRKQLIESFQEWKDDQGKSMELQFRIPNETEGGSSDYTLHCDDIVKGYVAMFGDAKSIGAATYGVAYGFRRFYAIIIANALLLKMEQPLIKQIKVLGPYNDDDARRVACVLENTKKDTGIRKLGYVDLVKSANDLWKDGRKQAEFRRWFRDGMGQKLYELCRMQQAHSLVDPVGRILKGEVNFTSLDKEKMREYNDKGVTDQEIRAYLSNPKGDNGNSRQNASKRMDKKRIGELAKTHDVDVVRVTMQAVESNNEDGINMLTKHKVLFNAVYKAATEQDPEAIKLVSEELEKLKGTSKPANEGPKKVVSKPGKESKQGKTVSA